jgi:hydrogenase nickel incorporation protein HypA/HybF
MHELGVTKSILDIVLRHAAVNEVERIRVIHLSIGSLSDLEPEWLQSYFDHLAQGTPAQGAELRVRRSPLTFLCEPCGVELAATREELEVASCPRCGSRELSLESGTAYMVESMEAQS